MTRKKRSAADVARAGGSGRRRGVSVLDHPQQAPVRKKVIEYLKACRDEGIFPNWSVLQSWLQEDYGVSLSAHALATWAKKCPETRDLAG